jgi:NAD(P)-dependent dehydrogenase (short-subunit alcohol dehydrogenase family)
MKPLMHIVIQGAGRGLGLAFAHHALRAGATKLYLTARNSQDSEGFRQLQPSENVQWFNLDFLNSDQIASTGEAILTATPHIDRVIVTAGVLHNGEIQPEKRVGALETEAMLHLYQVNAMGPVLFLKSLWPALRRAHPVTAASLSARVGSISDNRLGGWYSYRASKAALNQYMRTLSIELARYNDQAKIVTLHPGTVETDLSKPYRSQVAQGQLKSAAESADQLWAVLDRLSAGDSGGFFAYDGQPIDF